MATMNRRQAIKRTSLMTGAGLFAPGIFAALQSCANRDQDLNWDPRVLSQEQVVLLNHLSDTIVPETESPSASQVRVVEFVDLVMADVLTDDLNNSILRAIDELESYSISEEGSSFVELPMENRTNLVQAIDDAAFTDDPAEKMELTFLTDYRYLKSLVLMAYFTSEEGVKQNLDYVVIPGEYEPCITLPDDGKIMVGNHM